MKSFLDKIYLLMFFVFLFGSAKVFSNQSSFSSLPTHNIFDRNLAEIGKKLFFDTRLSGNKKISCANCHNPKLGGR